jgi:hypothetical protein
VVMPMACATHHRPTMHQPADRPINLPLHNSHAHICASRLLRGDHLLMEHRTHSQEVATSNI